MTETESNNPYQVSGSQYKDSAEPHLQASKSPGAVTVFVVTVMACVGGVIAFLSTCFGVGLIGFQLFGENANGFVLMMALAVGVIAAVAAGLLIFRSYLPKSKWPASQSISADISEQNDGSSNT